MYLRVCVRVFVRERGGRGGGLIAYVLVLVKHKQERFHYGHAIAN